MNGLEVNEYISKATEALADDPEHERWGQALKQRIQEYFGSITNFM